MLAASGAAALGTLARRRLLRAQDKPDEIIVRAWGGAWGEALKSGVADPFTEATGINVRLDFTEDNEIKPKIWSAVDQGRVPPIHVNWDTTTNATISARRGVTVDLSDLENLDGLLPLAKPGAGRLSAGEHLCLCLCLRLPSRGLPRRPAGSWQVMLDPKFKGRVALYDDGIGFNPIAVIAGGGAEADIPDNMEPGWEFYRKLKENEPLLGEDAGFHQLVPERRDRPRLHDLGQCPRRPATGSNGGLDRARGGLQGGYRRPVGAKGLPENEEHWAKQFVNLRAVETGAGRTGVRRSGCRVYPGLSRPRI